MPYNVRRHYDGGPDYQSVRTATEEYMKDKGADTLSAIRWGVWGRLGYPRAGVLKQRFCAQVYRALQEMATAGQLVKGGGGPHSDPWYLTPEKHAEAEAAREARLLEQSEKAARWAGVRAALEAQGFEVLHSTDGHPVMLTLEDWEKLTARLIGL